MSCAVGHRRVSDLALLWLWHRLAATALIQPLAWEPPCAVGVALKSQKKKKKKRSLRTKLLGAKEETLTILCFNSLQFLTSQCAFIDVRPMDFCGLFFVDNW